MRKKIDEIYDSVNTEPLVDFPVEDSTFEYSPPSDFIGIPELEE